MVEISADFWRRCSSCKKEIGYRALHYVCSVSTCTRKRTGYVFCSVHCWERHLPGARHRDAAAIEARSPSFEEWQKECADPVPTEPKPTTEPLAPKRVIIRDTVTTPNSNAPAKHNVPLEILVVVSKLKAYIKARSEMNTSDAVMDILSDRLRDMCDEAIEKARQAGRKTVLDRDFD